MPLRRFYERRVAIEVVEGEAIPEELRALALRAEPPTPIGPWGFDPLTQAAAVGGAWPQMSATFPCLAGAPLAKNISDHARRSVRPFYASKSDFLAESFAHVIGLCEAAAARTDPERKGSLPALQVFAHIQDARDFALSTSQSSEAPRLIEASESKLRAIAETNLARIKPDWPPARRRETAVFIAGGFMGLMRWQMEGGITQSPERLAAAFAGLARNALAEG